MAFSYDWSMFQSLLDLLFPRTSLKGDEGEFVTDRELQSLRSYPVIIDSVELRKNRVQHVDRIIAATTYQSSPDLREAVKRFKYHRVRDIHLQLGELMLPASSFFHLPADGVLCPVPLHWSRRFTRGFNQSDLLAHIVANANGWTVRPLLKRTRPTGHQAHRAHEDRWRAVEGAFKTIGSVPSHVILIDDVATTGATLDACAKALKESGAVHVDALVIAKG